MNTALVLVGLLLIAGFAVLVLILLLRHRHMKQAEGHTWVLHLTKTGKAKFRWVEDGGGGVAYKDGRSVITSPSRVFDLMWPPTGYPAVTQVKAGLAVVAEGNGEAWDPFDEDPIVSDAQVGAAYKGTVIKAGILQVGEELNKLAGKTGGVIKPLYLYVLLGAVLLGLVILGVYMFLTYQQVAYIQSAFGL